MSQVMCTLYAGEAIVDVTTMMPFLYDIAPGGTRGLKREQEGFPGVLGELSANFSTYGEQAGIAQAVYDRVLVNTGRIEQIRAMRVIAEAIVATLKDSEAKHEDEREADIGMIASAVLKAAQRKNEALLAPFEKTVRYHGQVGLRALKTRRKNAQAEAEAAEAEAQAQAEAAGTQAG